MKLRSNLIDIISRRTYPAEITIEGGKIIDITEISDGSDVEGYVLPGFVDAHIHIESSMMPPSEFARMAVVHGTVATVSDPHEIANVLGEKGVHYMLDDAAQVPFKFCFGAPSCVPATSFETNGAHLDAEAVRRLLENGQIGYLSEMMNFPGVIYKDPEVLKKIATAHELNKPIDGHAPGLKGQDAIDYFKVGITTDHECFTLEEAIGKAELGIKILIREGSAARNYEALHPLIKKCPELVMFCSDDKHPDDLIEGHINQLVNKSLDLGYNLYDVLYGACIHPVKHYQLDVGLLKVGDSADFIRIDSLDTFQVIETYIDGECVAQNGVSNIDHITSPIANNFRAEPKSPADFKLKATSSHINVIKALDGEIVTGAEVCDMSIANGYYESDVENDILKIVVVNRYTEQYQPAIGFVKGFGLTEGAIASSIAHDSHNIVAVGTSDELICQAVNEIINLRGGISAVNHREIKSLGLPIAGLMSPIDGYELAKKYSTIDEWTKSELGCILKAPFMLLSFLALPVIPSLKITDLGLFDVNKFEFTSVSCE